MSREIENYLKFYGPLPKPTVPAPPETWPIIEHEPEHIPEVPPELAFDEARNGIHATPDQRSQPAHTNEDRCPDCRTPAGARHYCDKAPAFFIPEANLASDDDRDG